MKSLLRKNKAFWAGLVLFHVLGSGLSQAATITLNYVDSGWYDSSGLHLSTNESYIAGELGGKTFRNFFVFDLSGVTETVISATLQLFNPVGGYASSDLTETYTVFDVTTAIASLTTTGVGQTGIYGDLGSGTSYGSQIVSAADNGALVNIALNGSALSAINGASGLFAFGGAITTLSAPLGTEHVFNNTVNTTDVRQLVLETQVSVPGSAPIPEPSTMILLGSGLIGLIGYRMKKNPSSLRHARHL